MYRRVGNEISKGIFDGILQRDGVPVSNGRRGIARKLQNTVNGPGTDGSQELNRINIL